MYHYLIVFLISMVPLIELRGAIPYAVAANNLGADLNMVIVYIIAIIGNMLPVPLIYFFARKVLIWGKDKKYIGKFFTFCLEKGEKGGRKLEAKAGKGLFVALMLFLQFTKVSPHDLKFRRWHLWLLLFQTFFFVALALIATLIPHGSLRILVECAMLCIICPTAAAAGVIAVLFWLPLRVKLTFIFCPLLL